jgi:predicted lipase
LLQNRNPTFNLPGVPIQQDSANETVIHQGFTSLTVFGFDTKQWLTRSPQTNIPANIMYSAQTVVFNPRSNLIYYLGGFFSSSTDYSKENKMTFTTANVFDTKSGAWNTINLNGKYPSSRMFPTATLSEYDKNKSFFF